MKFSDKVHVLHDRPNSKKNGGTRVDEPNGGAPNGGAPRPVVRIVAGELPRIADEAEQALIDADLPIFARAGALVCPITDEAPASNGHTTTVAKLRPMCRETMLEALSQAAAFVRYDARSKKWVRTDPPTLLATLLLAREGKWRFRRVVGVITTPTLRPDGSLLSERGYDPETRLYLADHAALKMPPILERPSREQAQAALQLLAALLVNFPFKQPLDHAVALSAILTAVLRGACPVAPLHAVSAHTPGTGKSYLVDLASAIASGREWCPVITPGKTDEELEKRLGALLRDSVPIVSLDNLSTPLGGDLLCQVVERPLVRCRILGLSEAPEFECRAAVFATGNNLTVGGDMAARRVLLCRLDAGMERPETRAFPFKPVQRVLDARGAYVAAVITIARAYRAAGCPKVCGPIASYEAWSELVRAPLIWLGEKDPVESVDIVRKHDPVLTNLREIIDHWKENLGLNKAYTATDIIKAATEKEGHQYDVLAGQFLHPEWRDSLLRVAGEGGAISGRKLGWWLTANAGRPVDGYKLQEGESANKHAKPYVLIKA